MEDKTITLVVNADDFGLSEGINQGIVSACHHGIVRSASLMPNGSAFEDAVRISEETPELEVGVHISLVGERSLAFHDGARGFAADGGLLPATFGDFVKQYMFRRFSLQDVHREIQAQVDRVLSAGIKPTHIDSHQHLHVFPGVLEVVIQAAKSAGIPIIRFPLEKNGIGKRPVSRILLSTCCRRARPKIDRAGLRFADHFWGFGVSGSMTEENLVSTLNRLQPGVNEIMCHPGYPDTSTSSRYNWGYNWDAEVEGLCSERVKQIIRERNIRLMSF